MALKKDKHARRVRAFHAELPPPFNERHEVDPDVSIILPINDDGAVSYLRELSAPTILRKIRNAMHEAHWWYLEDEIGDWVMAVRQLAGGDLETFPDTAEHLDVLRTHCAWQTVFLEGILQESRRYGISVFGLDVTHLHGLQYENGQATLIRQFFDQNASCSVLTRPDDIQSIRIRHTNRGKPICVINLIHPGTANELIRSGAHWESVWYPCRKYIRDWSLYQCSKCQSFGHKSARCTQGVRCAKCTGPHGQSQCQSPKLECANCGGPHRSTFFLCPQRKKEAEGLRNLQQLPGNAGRFWPVPERQKDPANGQLTATPSSGIEDKTVRDAK
ncbi:MAG: hypothetical protein L6R40_004272 [Gallowayella cf. fulva]|nr:MAG: hypothetical protein L6R40_004272 [Xanthomendoza cf. fulva]